MNAYLKTLMILFNLFSIGFSDVNITNQIENDHRIRNFAFIGPFPKYYNVDSLISTLDVETFALDKTVLFENQKYNWSKPPASTGSYGFHNVWNYYPDVKVEEIILAVSIVNSNSNQSIIANIMQEWYCQASIYINSEKIYDRQMSMQNELNRGSLVKGGNMVCVKVEAIKEPGFNLLLYPESRAEIKGKVLDKDGKIVPFAKVRVYEINSGRWHGDNTDAEGNYEIDIFPVNQNDIYNMWAFGGNKRAYKSLLNLKKSDRKRINFVVGKASRISGEVLKLDGKGKQYGTVVQAVGLDNYNNEDERVMFTRLSNLEGEFRFDALPNTHKYHLRIHGENEFIYLIDKKGNKRIFDPKVLDDSTYTNIKVNTRTSSKGTWSQITYIDGLQSDYTYSSAIDKDNKLIFGSYSGISFYDGQDIQNITQYDGLPQQPIGFLYKDKDNTVWAGATDGGFSNVGGLVKLKNTKVDKVYGIEDGLKGYNVRAFGEDVNGNLLIGGSGGLSIFDGENFKNFNSLDGIPFGWVNSILVEGTNIWLGTLDGLVLYNGKKFRVYNKDDGLVHQWIECIKKGPKGNIWIGTQGGLSIFDGAKFNNLKNKDGLIDVRLKDIFFDESGDAVISTQDGVYKYNGLTFVRLDPRTVGYDFSLSSSFKITKSNDGIYWFTSSGSGAVKYDPNSIINTTESDSFPKTEIFDIKVDKNRNLWFGTSDQGLIQMSENKIVKQLKVEQGLRSNGIRALDFDMYGNIWMATNSGLSKYDGRKVSNFTTKDGIASDNIRGLLTDDRGNIWLATPMGLTKFDGSKATNYGEEHGLTPQRATDGYDIAMGGPENIIVYAISRYGFSIFKDEKFENFSTEQGLPDPRVTCVDIDSEGNIWLGTDGSGVVKYDGKFFKTYTREDGVANPEIRNIYIDDYDKVWIGTYGSGVGVFDGETWGSIDKRDGLVDNTISALTSFGNNIYWFGSGTGEGFSEYKPSTSPGFSKIKEIITSKNRYESFSGVIPNSLTDNRISFVVNAANYNTHKDKQKFRYRIKEVSEKWSRPSKNSTFEWVPKTSGEFTFEVQSIDRDLNYSNPTSAIFKVDYPWYKEPKTAIPFWGLIVFIISLSGYSTNNYFKQRSVSLSLIEEKANSDSLARKQLEEKNSELQDSQKEAEAANEAKSTFLANMSHELRTPLNAIIGYSEMLMEDAEDENEDFIPDLDKINGSGKHLLGLINDILDLSKVESGKMELYIEEFDLAKIISEVKDTIKPLVEKNNNKLVIEYNADEKKMSADLTKIRQILLNLLSNSAKFTKDGAITISVNNSTSNKDAIDFNISDTGIGMTPEQVDKVFKPFTQADEKTTRKFGGTGLGLTITKMFAEMMGGDINLTSKENEGTTFTATIPLKVKDLKIMEPDNSGEIIKENESDYKVLVIDDDDNAQDMMKKFLEKQKVTIIQAKSGEEGLKLAAEYLPDAITLDVMMPEMDGWEVLTALQSNDVTKNIPVIMLTMADEPDIGYSLGATDYLTKPVNWNQLSNILSNHKIESASQTILIVEDDDTTREMLKKSLTGHDFKVRIATNGREGLEKVKDSKPGLVLLDLMMPEMDGFEFAEKLRENKDWLDIPVVVITAKDLTSADHKRLRGNVEAIMQKGSYSKKELMSEVGDRIKLLKKRS